MLLSEFLADFPDVDREAGAALAEMAAQVVHLDRKASLGIAFALEKKGGRVMVQIGHTAKPPKPDPEAGLYFLNRAGDALTKDDPWQMGLGDYDPETGEILNKETS